MKKKIIGLSLFCLLLLESSSFAFGTTEKTIYAKEATWLYSSGHETARYAVVPVGKHQKLIAGNLVTAVTGRKKTYFYEVECFGQTLYIPKSKVTVRKPKQSIRVRYTFKELWMRQDAKMYLFPDLSGKSCNIRDRRICTIGQMKNWYIVFVEGRLGYIRKKDNAIQFIKEIQTIPIHIRTREYPSAAERQTMKKRILLQYAQLSQTMRDQLQQRKAEIYCMEHLIEPFESRGSLGYTESQPDRAFVYVKNEGIEFSLIHELGHAITRHVIKQAKHTNLLLAEQNCLKVEPYFAKNFSEWIAESVRIFVKMPQTLRTRAPKTYAFLLRQIFHTLCPLRTAS